MVITIYTSELKFVFVLMKTIILNFKKHQIILALEVIT